MGIRVPSLSQLLKQPINRPTIFHPAPSPPAAGTHRQRPLTSWWSPPASSTSPTAPTGPTASSPSQPPRAGPGSSTPRTSPMPRWPRCVRCGAVRCGAVLTLVVAAAALWCPPHTAPPLPSAAGFTALAHPAPLLLVLLLPLSLFDHTTLPALLLAAPAAACGTCRASEWWSWGRARPPSTWASP